MSDKETRQLIQELQVHQIELEMQNEELRRAQSELEESRAKYSDFYDFAPVGYWTFDKNGLILEANLTAAKEVGLERSLLINKPFRAYIVTEDREIFDSHLQQVFKSDDRQSCEIRLKRKNGIEIYAQVESLAAHDMQGNTLARTSAIDITERKRAEEELKASEARFRNLVEATSDWVWEVDAQGIYTYASPKVKDILGYEISEILGKTPFALMPPDEAKRVFKIFSSLAAQRKPFNFLENTNRHKDGHWVVLETSGVPIFNDDGDFLGYRGIDRDITERKQMEEALRIKNNAIESSINGIVITDIKGKLTYTNNSFLKMWGYDGKEVLGKHIVEFCQDEDEVTQVMEELQDKGWIGEMKAKRKDGSLFDVSFSASMVKDNADNPICMMASFIDITETVQLREKLHIISFQDKLTGLYNRRGFFNMAERQLKVAKRTKKELALFFLDLDKLKWINDNFGHNEGDLALIETANILKKSFREVDILARFGGDEFVILATDASESSAEILTVRLYEYLTAHNSKETCRYNLSLSIGISCYDPESPASLEELISQADSAMYEQKKSRRKIIA